MNRSHYANYDSSSALILRDHLAIERTSMANERTLLAYVRTMIGIIAVGGTILKLFDGWFYVATGVGLIIFGLAVLVVGFLRYSRILVFLREIYKKDEVSNDDWMHQMMWVILDKTHLAGIFASRSVHD